MTTVRATQESGSEYLTFAFRYDRDVIDILKEASRGLRNYDPQTKSWSVHESVAEQVIDAMSAAGHEVLSGDEQPKPAAVALPSANDFFGTATVDAKNPDRAMITALAESFLETVPAHLAHRVFRAVARRLYPDLYGKG